MYREGLRSRRSLGRAMPSSDEKRQAQQVARRLKARQLKIQTLLEKLPGARQPATTIARPTPRDYSPPAALTLVPFRQSLTCCCTAAHESLSARMRSGHTLSCISLLHTYAYPLSACNRRATAAVTSTCRTTLPHACPAVMGRECVSVWGLRLKFISTASDSSRCALGNGRHQHPQPQIQQRTGQL